MLKVKQDDLLPTEFVVKYNNFIEELRKLSFVQQHNITELELHGFCNASIQANSIAVYVRLLKNNNYGTSLLTAKSKIVPNVYVRKALSAQVKISNVLTWSDSKVALY